MRKWNALKCSVVPAVLFAAYLLAGCTSPKIRIEQNDKYFVASQRTGLIAGLKRIEDKRPPEQITNDEKYQTAKGTVVDEHLYRNLKFSGIFEDVLRESFDVKDVDVVIAPQLRSFQSSDKLGPTSAAAVGIALIPIVNLIYLAASGPKGDRDSNIAIDVKILAPTGFELRGFSIAKKSSVLTYLNEDAEARIGAQEGLLLGEAMHDLTANLSSSLESVKVNSSRAVRGSVCKSDYDCKGSRICSNDKCVDPVQPRSPTATDSSGK